MSKTQSDQCLFWEEKKKPQIHNKKPIAIQNTFCNAQPKQNINIATQESLNFCILYQIGKVILC